MQPMKTGNHRKPLFKWEIDVNMLVLPHGRQPNQGVLRQAGKGWARQGGLTIRGKDGLAVKAAYEAEQHGYLTNPPGII
jgi:hypothetical protein